MKFTKKQALDLFAILSHYEAITERIDVNVLELRDEVEDFILFEENNEKTNEYGKAEEDSEEEDEEECGEQDQKIDVDENQVTNYVQTKSLRALTKCHATTLKCSSANFGMNLRLRFGHHQDPVKSEVMLFVSIANDPNAAFVLGPIRYIKRNGTQISLCEIDIGVKWHTFVVGKFPKEWTKLLPVNDLIEIVNYEL